MKKIAFLLSFLLALAVPGHSQPSLAESSTPADLLQDLRKQGWSEVSPGVLQRSLGGNRVETLGFGAAGLRFQLEEMKAHLADLRKEYARYPSQELRITIRAHRAQILRIEEALNKSEADGLESSAEGLILQAPNCAVSYDASAIAFPLPQGAASKATAFFNNPCDYTGEVYAHSKSKAVAADNSVALVTQSDPALDTPRIGNNVSAGASTSANGVKECDSYAYASVVNYALEIVYVQSDRFRLFGAQDQVLPTEHSVRRRRADFRSGLGIADQPLGRKPVLHLGRHQWVDSFQRIGGCAQQLALSRGQWEGRPGHGLAQRKISPL